MYLRAGLLLVSIPSQAPTCTSLYLFLFLNCAVTRVNTVSSVELPVICIWHALYSYKCVWFLFSLLCVCDSSICTTLPQGLLNLFIMPKYGRYER